MLGEPCEYAEKFLIETCFFLVLFPCPILFPQFLSLNSVITLNAFQCIDKYVGIAGFSQWFQSFFQGLLRTPSPLKRSERSNYFIIILIIHHLHFLHSFSNECTMEFFRSYRMSDKAIALMANEMYEAVMSISLFSVKPDIKVIWKQVKQCYFSHQRFLLWKI